MIQHLKLRNTNFQLDNLFQDVLRPFIATLQYWGRHQDSGLRYRMMSRCLVPISGSGSGACHLSPMSPMSRDVCQHILGAQLFVVKYNNNFRTFLLSSLKHVTIIFIVLVRK